MPCIKPAYLLRQAAGYSELALGVQPVINWQDHAGDLFDDDGNSDSDIDVGESC